MELQITAHAKIDLGLPQETYLTDRVYTRESAGFHVIALEAPIRHRGCVTLFYKESRLFAIESYQQHVPNIINFQMVTET